MRPAAASTNRKQMLQEATVSVLGAGLKDFPELPVRLLPNPSLLRNPFSGWFYKCSCPATGIWELH